MPDRCRLTTLALAAASFFCGAGPTWAGPERCTVSPSGLVAACAGNQSAGLEFGVDVKSPITTVVVDALTIGPGAGGRPSIDFSSLPAALKYSLFMGVNSSDPFSISGGSGLSFSGGSSALAVQLKNGKVESSFAALSSNFTGASAATVGGNVGAGTFFLQDVVLSRSFQAFEGNRAALSVQATGGNGGQSGGTVGDTLFHLDNVTIDSEAGGLRTTLAGGNGTTRNAKVGGNGGVGGKASLFIGEFIAGSSVKVTTRGEGSAGLFFLTTGGAGGDGDWRNVVTGEAGGAGGSGGFLETGFGSSGVLDVETVGRNAPGVRLESAGGKGGNAGYSNLATGGRGGEGANGGPVSFASSSGGGAQVKLTTLGDNSPGVLLSSMGGEGGAGGTAQVFGKGGEGGSSGGGGDINFGRVGAGPNVDIETSGDASAGMAMYSFGGDAGRGGNGNVFARGGAGGDTSRGSGTVRVNEVTGRIRTRGTESFGILAESVAGRSGGGGDAYGFFGFAAGTRSAGVGGDVSVNNAAVIITEGDQSAAIAAASFGGGGGLGGSGYGVYLGQAGNGSSGGNGGRVEVTNRAALTTFGNDAQGILAASIGGTGGRAGNSAGLVALGGKSEYGGDGSAVTVNNSARIETGAARGGLASAPPPIKKICGDGCSPGILAMSVGGGGGIAGTQGGLVSLGGAGGPGGSAGAVKISNAADIRTTLNYSAAVEALSEGGGGGKGGGAIALSPLLPAVAIGGSGGTGGNGGGVSVDTSSSNRLETLGDGSAGISAMSGGGGGGTGGFAVSIAGSPYLAASLSIGGSGGSGGSGGAVTVSDRPNLRPSIRTVGDGSDGIFAQSVGGGGGNGQFAISAGASPESTLAMSIGGSGGKGGRGAAVDVTTSASITTEGDDSRGILAQSVGGGGGNGSFGLALAGAHGALSFGVGGGGTGGGGGAGQNVTVKSTGDWIRTSGLASPAILAQSISNGGGSGGAAVSVLGGAVTGLTFSVGGMGGTGGDAGEVRLRNLSDVATAGANSTGLVAQSIGGGGGNAGLAFSGTLSKEGGGVGSLAIGGDGGSGGRGKTVAVENAGAISVSGSGSMGISAQSTGNAGGRGGMSLAGTSGGSGGANQISVAVGGNGGAGGSAGNVTVNNSGDIFTGVQRPGLSNDVRVTIDFQEYGIFAQSVGGNGGAGGTSGTLTVGVGGESAGSATSLNMGVSVGGWGGKGSMPGNVRVENSGRIATRNLESHAIFAQSIGGNGGVGGSAVNYVVQLGQPAELLSVINVGGAVGGVGGDGAIGKAVTVSNSAGLETDGYNSHGLFAHSVGGGGGSGGAAGNTVFTVAGFRPDKDQNSLKLQASIGGFGGKGNNGGPVQVDNSGSIRTRADGAYGIYAYSIGAGGGDGGSAAGVDRQIPGIPFTDRVTLLKNLQLSIGGFSGATGDGDTVTVNQAGGRIDTEGQNAPAIFAQSVGGGGGNGGGSATSYGATISVGGYGGAGGNGGNVTVNTQSVDIKTLGAGKGPNKDNPTKVGGSHGIFAQSVGGGGGVGGDAKLQGIPGGGSIPGCQDFCGRISVGAGIPIGLPGGKGGNGGIVNVIGSGSIDTTMANAVGIFAQSVGGGGGIAGWTASSLVGGGPADAPYAMQSLIGSGSAAGSGGRVVVNYTGSITTTGGGSHGIFAQSAGGKPLAPDSALKSFGGNVFVPLGNSTRIDTSGTDAVGIYANSEGGEGNGDIGIDIGVDSSVSGGRTGGTNPGAGILLKEGRNNTVSNFGTITSQDKIALVTQGSGKVTVTNYAKGVFDGDVLLSTGANLFNNLAGGEIRAKRIDLGGGSMNNNGVISPGGSGTIAAASLRGTLVNGATGILAIDLQSQGGLGDASQADLLTVSGGATLGGTVLVNVLGLGLEGKQAQTVPILHALGGITTSGLSARSANGSDALVVQWQQPTANELVLVYGVDFDNAAVLASANDDQDQIAQQLDALYRADVLTSADVLKLVSLDGTTFSRALTGMGPEIAVDTQIASLQASLRFGDLLRRCDGAADACSWGRVQVQDFSLDRGNDNAGFNASIGQLAFGVQTGLGGGWRAGAALAWEGSKLSSNSAATSHGDRLQFGLTAGRKSGDVDFSASLAFSQDRNKLSRQPLIGGLPTTADQTLRTFMARAGGGSNWRNGSWDVKPSIDVGLIRMQMPGFDEGGKSAFRLRVQGRSGTYGYLQPGVEVSSEMRVSNGMRVRPRMGLSVTRLIGSTSASATAAFVAQPGVTAPFSTRTAMDRTSANMAAGVDLLQAGHPIVRVEALVGLSRSMSHYGASLKVQMPF